MSNAKTPGFDSHFFHYAKGGYEQGDLMKDLQQIMAERCCLYANDVSIGDIESILLDIVYEYCITDRRSFMEFMEDISPSRFFRWIREDIFTARYAFAEHPDYDFHIAVISKCLSMIRLTQIQSKGEDGKWVKLIELEPAIKSVLPLSEKRTLTNEKASNK